MKTVLKVPDMACMHCVKSISGALERIPGVVSVSADLESKNVSVEHAETVSFAELADAVEEVGFDVERK